MFESKESPDDGETDITEGVLVAVKSGKAYPVIDGVPVMIDSMFPQEFLEKHTRKIRSDETLSTLKLPSPVESEWSFSAQWDAHFDGNVATTWGWTAEQRVQQFLLETETGPDECAGQLILDAGCGNGNLSECLARLGATVIGLDYSDSVRRAEKRRTCPGVHFVQGDLQNPPFDSDTFTMIVSNGVLHHTPNTYNTFVAVAGLAKPQGRFYLWLYRKPEAFYSRYVMYPVFDLIRLMVSRFGTRPRTAAVKAYALGLWAWHKMRGKYKDRQWRERVVGAWDALTPRWRYYHTPLEVSCWFFTSGYSAPTITHWDNPYGFGMVARKKRQSDTPGLNFGASNPTVRRYYA